MTCQFLLTVACCGVLPVYDPQPDHPWNRLYDVFYTHEFTNGIVYAHPHAFDPPFSTWARFYNDEKFHDHVVTVLDTFLNLPAEQVEQQSPVRRALMWRDLWPVFDWQTIERQNATEAARKRQPVIRERVAKAMRRLVLSEDEARRLPDNFRQSCDQNRFPTNFDPTAPETPFLPPDLFDPEGAWVPFSRNQKTPGARAHVESTRHRTVFVPYINVGGNRQETIDFLKRYSKTGGLLLPRGTMLALGRRTVAMSPTGELQVTPLLESLQLLVIDEPQDRRFKFVWDRAELLDGGSGLHNVGPEETADAWGFESSPFYGHNDKLDADGEELVFRRSAAPASQGAGAMGTCVGCHGLSTRGRLYANTVGQSDRAAPLSFSEQARLILTQKKQHQSWKAFLELRD